MTNVILQPASDRAFSRPNYQKTIESPVSIERIKQHLSGDELANITSLISTDGICTWGIKPSMIRQWEKIDSGDTVLFAWDSHYRSMANVFTKVRNPGLATELWGIDDAGNTWELIYFLSQPVGIDIPYTQLNAIGGYKPNYVPQGVNVVQGDKSERILTSIFGVLPTQVRNKVIANVDDIQTLDRVSASVVRGEQSILRSSLLGDSENGICGICGSEYPVSFLIAAHIKKRAHCTDAEKRNIPSIAMPMCAMGCDALFESGYVTVENKIIKTAETTNQTLRLILDGLSGSSCSYWTEEREQYFSWHKENTFRDR